MGYERDEQFLKLAAVGDLVGFKPTWIWAQIAAGQFPKPISIGDQGPRRRPAARWLKSEVIEWQRAQIVNSRGAR